MKIYKKREKDTKQRMYAHRNIRWTENNNKERQREKEKDYENMRKMNIHVGEEGKSHKADVG